MPQRSTEICLVRLDREYRLWYRPRRGIYPAAWRYRDVPGAAWWEFPRVEFDMKRKVIGAAGEGDKSAKHLAAVESRVFQQLPNIVAHCCVTRYDDFEARRPGWITVSTLGSAWKVAVKDPDGCCQMSAVANTLDDALALADMLLGSDDAPWEPDPFLKRQSAGKKS